MKTFPLERREHWRRLRRENKSQALAEFAIILPMLLMFVCGLLDYGLMVSKAQVMAMMVREGANVASRYDTDPINTALAAMVDNGKPSVLLNSSLGGAVITYVTRSGTQISIFGGAPTTYVGSTGTLFGGYDALKNKSRLVTNGNWNSNPRQLPFSYTTLDEEQKMYCVELFYSNRFITPVGFVLVGVRAMPPFMYDAAFF
jgi:Flp pilus assembly protein TadG